MHDQITSGSITPFASAVPTRGRSASALTASAELVAGFVGVGQQVGRLGERVVAQVEDELLGRQRLAGDPGRALRLAAAALRAGAQVEQALPGQVLDLADAEHVDIRVGLLEVEHLAGRAHRLERPQARSGDGRT